MSGRAGAPRRIHLLRHAKSDWSDGSLRDRERPLAPRGRKACRALARHLREHPLGVELVLCSTARRARETLDGVAEALGDVEVRYEEAIYGASARELLEFVRGLPEEVGSVLLVGHNPGFETFALLLAGEGSESAGVDAMRAKYPTGALASFEGPGSWSAVGPGSCALRAFVRPRELGG